MRMENMAAQTEVGIPQAQGEDITCQKLLSLYCKSYYAYNTTITTLNNITNTALLCSEFIEGRFMFHY